MIIDEMVLQDILSLIINGFKRVQQKDSYKELNMIRQGWPECIPPCQQISASDSSSPTTS